MTGREVGRRCRKDGLHPERDIPRCDVSEHPTPLTSKLPWSFVVSPPHLSVRHEVPPPLFHPCLLSTPSQPPVRPVNGLTFSTLRYGSRMATSPSSALSPEHKDFAYINRCLPCIRPISPTYSSCHPLITLRANHYRIVLPKLRIASIR